MLNNDDEKLLKKLTEANSEFAYLVDKLHEQQQFTLSKISHEIRNPLTLIISSMQLIQNQHPEVASYRHWHETLNDLDYLKELLNDLSTFNNGGNLKCSTVCLPDMISTIAESINESYQSEIVFFQFEKPFPALQGDPIKLKQCLINLLKNAAEALDIPGRIDVSLSLSGSNAKLSIKDNGCGIPEEYLTDLFEPFVTHKKQGTGLGLAITQSIIYAHKGTISVSSVPAVGTEFTIMLPLK